MRQVNSIDWLTVSFNPYNMYQDQKNSPIIKLLTLVYTKFYFELLLNFNMGTQKAQCHQSTVLCEIRKGQKCEKLTVFSHLDFQPFLLLKHS